MDIELKVDLIERMRLIQVLLLVPHDPSKDDDCGEELANLCDTVFLALIGHYQKVEETSIIGSVDASASLSANEAGLVGRVAGMMNALFPLLLRLFHSSETSVSCAVMPSLNRFTSLLKQQLNGRFSIESVLSRKLFADYFLADHYTIEVLLAVYKKMQYPDDFAFDPNDDDDAEEMEVSRQNYTVVLAELATGSGK